MNPCEWLSQLWENVRTPQTADVKTYPGDSFMSKFKEFDTLEELAKLFGMMNWRDWVERYHAAHRVSHSETCAEIVRSADRLANASFRLFAEKSKSEQTAILARVTELSEDLNKALGEQPPLIIALALLTAIRVQEQLCNRAKVATARS